MSLGTLLHNAWQDGPLALARPDCTRHFTSGKKPAKVSAASQLLSKMHRRGGSLRHRAGEHMQRGSDLKQVSPGMERKLPTSEVVDMDDVSHRSGMTTAPTWRRVGHAWMLPQWLRG